MPVSKLRRYCERLDMYSHEAKIRHKHRTIFGAMCTIFVLLSILVYCVIVLKSKLLSYYTWRVIQYDRNKSAQSNNFDLPHQHIVEGMTLEKFDDSWRTEGLKLD